MELCEQCKALQAKRVEALQRYHIAFAARDRAAQIGEPEGFREVHERVIEAQNLVRETRKELERHRAGHP